jgi:hypothetical protein
MSDHTKDKVPCKGSSEKSPTKFMERPGAKPHPENELTRDRYEQGANSEVAGPYADPHSDEDAAEIRVSDETKIHSKRAPNKAVDPTLKNEVGLW